MGRKLKGVSFNVQESLSRQNEIMGSLRDKAYQEGNGDYLAGTKPPRRTIRSEVKKATISTLEQSQKVVRDEIRRLKAHGAQEGDLRSFYAILSSIELLKDEA
ncbi:hypothetical protein [Rahnella variigena]|uniref:hypothetical protein n=1 Tax=Rahnella variigena TaxID=574964 RepID=UPI0028DBD3C0|nr:hypothetical protein [Rahnella variigena]